MSAVKEEPKCDPSLSDQPANQAGPSTPSGTKRKAETDSPETPNKAQKRDETTAPPEPQHSRCVEFWYPDGNVVILIQNTAFKLYKARLSKYCAVLAARFAEDDGASRQTMERCPIYEVERLSVDEFKLFLEALETPFIFASNPPTQTTALAILRASHVLDCPDMRAFAIGKLRGSWPPDKPKLPGGRRNPNQAIHIIQVARECNAPELCKRAYYELIRNPNVWSGLARNRAVVKLPEADLITLLLARQELQRLWFELVFEPPCKEEGACSVCQGMRRGGFSRSATWRNQMIEDGHFEAGRVDPIGYLELLLTEKRKYLEGAGQTNWCTECVQERIEAWAEAQKEWWAKLDEWFKL